MKKLGNLLFAAMALFVYAAIAPFLYAAEVTPEQAVTAAQNWIRTSRNPLEARFASADAVSMQTGSNEVGRAIFHAVNLEGGGFVITSGDTRLAPIIAFSDAGSYDGNTESPLYALLRKGQSEAVAALDSPRPLRLLSAGNTSDDESEDAGNPYAEAMAEWDELLSGTGTDTAGGAPLRLLSDNGQKSVSDVRVNKLLQTEWDQKGFFGDDGDYVAVYNYYSPLDVDDCRMPCGCAATAGAQIMYYWKSPTASIAQFSRQCKVEGEAQTLTSIAGTFDWNNMFLTWKFDPYDAYGNLPSEAKRKAVSKLTYNIGVALGMEYGTIGSTAPDGCFKFVDAVKSVFGYKSGTCVLHYLYALDSGMSQGADFEERKADFNNALYASLDAKMPVFMSIEGNVGGHAIVADGYGYISGRRYTHLNFGYGSEEASADAWYCLIDETLVTYGSSENYWRFVALGFNIHPTTAGDVISGRVLNSSSSPVSGATVTLYDSSNNAKATASTDAKGIYSFRITAAGNYSVKATSGSQTSPSKSVSVAALSRGGSCGSSNEGALTGNRWGNDLTLAAASASTSNVGFNPNGGTLSGGNFGSKNGTTQTATLTLTYGKGSYNSGMRAARGTGYAFNGFWTAASGGSQIYDANGKYVPNSRCWTSSGTWKHTGNAMLYAQWHTHTVKFDPNGGTLNGGNFGAKNGTTQVASLQVTCGAGAYNSGMRATKSGSAFNGWWTAKTGGSKQYDANGKFVAGSTCWDANGKWKHHGNAALYAHWAQGTQLTANPYGGKLNGGNFGSDNGTTSSHTVDVTYGGKAYNTLGTATKSGYVFQGWYTNPSGGYMVFDPNGKFVEGDYWDSDGKWKFTGSAVTVYARWLAAGTTYTLTCKPQGGTLKGSNFGSDNGTSRSHDVSVVTGSGAYNVLGTATKDGYKFLGWYSDPTSGSPVFDANGKFVADSWCWNAAGQWVWDRDVTVYARWAEASTLTCNPNGGKLNGGNFGSDNGKATTHSVILGKGTSAYSTLGTATKDGYVFTGWYTADDDPVYDYDGKAWTRSSNLFWNGDTWRNTTNVTVYAKWESRSAYTLTCNPNGGTLKGNNFGSDNGTSNAHAVNVTVGASAYNVLGTAVRSGHKFLGWYRIEVTGYMQYRLVEKVFDENGKWVPSCIEWGGPWMWSKTGVWMCPRNITLYAKWEAID